MSSGAGSLIQDLLTTFLSGRLVDHVTSVHRLLEPWMNDAFELDRKRTASATSCGVPFLFMGAMSTPGLSSGISAVIGVLRELVGVSNEPLCMGKLTR